MKVSSVVLKNEQEVEFERLYREPSLAKAAAQAEKDAEGEFTVVSINTCEVLTPVKMLKHLLTQAYCPCARDIERTLQIFGEEKEKD